MQPGSWAAAQCSGTTSQPSNCCSFCVKVNNDARATADPCKSSSPPTPTVSQSPAGWRVRVSGPSAPSVGHLKRTGAKKSFQLLLAVPGQGMQKDKRQLTTACPLCLPRCPASTPVQLPAREKGVRKGKAAGCTIHPAARDHLSTQLRSSTRHELPVPPALGAYTVSPPTHRRPSQQVHKIRW